VEEVFLRTAWTRRGLIVGHNLPYDLVQISISHHPPQSGAMMRGGFSLAFSHDPNASRVQIKRSNAGAAFIRLTSQAGPIPSIETASAADAARTITATSSTPPRSAAPC